MSATATKPTATETEGMHYFHTPKQRGQVCTNLRVYIPRTKGYVQFRSNYFETADDLLAEDLLAIRAAGYVDFEYETPEQRAARARRKKEEEAAAKRGVSRLAEYKEAQIAEERERAEAIARRAW